MTRRALPRRATINVGVAALVWLRAAHVVLSPDATRACRRSGSATELRLQSYLRPCRGAPVLRAMRDKSRADRKSTRLNSSHGYISYAVFCLKKKKKCHTP